MWLCGYWMERGHKAEEILALSPEERTVWQAIAELNEEKANQNMKNNMIEALNTLLSALSKGR